MCQSRREISLGFTSERFCEGLHIVYIFNDDSERRRTIAKYVESGLLEGEKVSHMADTMTVEELEESLKALGVDVESSQKALSLSKATPIYCPDGRFSSGEMLNVLKEFYQQAIREGFSGARVAGEAVWALNQEGVHLSELLVYEAKVTQLLEEYPCTACCEYDARLFDGSTIMDVLSVHPMMVIRGQLVKNPHFVQPEKFLEQHNARPTDRPDV